MNLQDFTLDELEQLKELIQKNLSEGHNSRKKLSINREVKHTYTCKLCGHEEVQWIEALTPCFDHTEYQFEVRTCSKCPEALMPMSKEDIIQELLDYIQEIK